MHVRLAAMALLFPSLLFAQEEIAEGYPEHMAYQLGALTISEDGVQDQFAYEALLWEPGSTLKVCFFGGDEVVRKLIESVASEWTQYANLAFEFRSDSSATYDCGSPSSGHSQIRIGFSERGYWSAIGRLSVTKFNKFQPSMNFEGFDVEFSEDQGLTEANVVKRASDLRKSTILHEFGHAIGLLHEHQNPNFDCWSEIKQVGPGNVYDFFEGPPNNWNKSKTDANLKLMFAKGTVARTPDAASIMMYLIDEKILVNGKKSPCFLAAKNKGLSALDKDFVSSLYPAVSNGSEPIDDAVLIESQFQPSDSALVGDFIERTFVDLESRDPSIRRGARSELADFASVGSGLEEIFAEVSNRTDPSYRIQLGIAVALAGAKGDIKLSDEFLNVLNSWREASTDSTLDRELDRALRK